ncbi:FliH/SctL family protein [Marinomonas fungiae]|uniref:Flagellar assembly protein FliH n=1 Tax=Marinomonas fungiae TaxID=1137284 RepID=A0A0K6IIS9_9GAMM|nr:FliH/SctL family protein [Marinomonas fungiae]CUB03009.1 Flagellar biosynthesis/type III secretory pathway protein FliH [Marinomonas fungiae]
MSDNEKKLTAYERWELPNLEGQNSNPRPLSQALVIKDDEAVEITEEIDEDSVVYEPLTAQQLEEIRLAAYEEGFAQGQQEGQAAGYEEGFAKGQEEGLQQGLEQGHEAGKAEAHTQGIELAQAQVGELETLLNGVLKEFEQPLESSRDRLEQLLQTATKRIVEHVIRRELSEDSSELIHAELEKILNTLGENEGRAVLLVHPESIQAIEALAAEQRLTIKIKPDASLMEGGFILDSHDFYVDGTVESRLNEVLKSLDKPQ